MVWQLNYKYKKFIYSVMIFLVGNLICGCGNSSYNNNISIKVENIENLDQSGKIVCVKDEYYYYDFDLSAIMCCSALGETEKLFDTDEIYKIAGNKECIFFLDMNNILYQYNLESKMLFKTSVSEEEWLNQICATEQHIFIQGENNIYIFSAENICEKANMPFDLVQIQNEAVMYENEIDGKHFLASIEQDNLLYNLIYYGKDLKNSFRVLETDTYICLPIYNEEYSIALSLFNSTGEKIFGESYNLGYYNDSFYLLLEHLHVYNEDEISQIDNGYIYGYGGGDYAVECSSIDDNKAVIVSSNYRSSDLTLESGSLCDHETDNIWYVDLEKNETWKNYCFERDEIVLYADLEKYMLFKNYEMIIYDAESQKELLRQEATWFEEEGQHQYEIILCHNQLFVFDESGLVESVSLQELKDM